jgi:type II secretory pathway component GspD/PulD (secretin)
VLLSYLDGAGLVSIGSPLGTALNLGNKISLSVMLNFLRKQGNVRVDNQPNITVTNGREAYITTGDEFSYIASIILGVTLISIPTFIL